VPNRPADSSTSFHVSGFHHIARLDERIQRAAPNDAARLAEQLRRQVERRARQARRRRG